MTLYLVIIMNMKGKKIFFQHLLSVGFEYYYSVEISVIIGVENICFSEKIIYFEIRAGLTVFVASCNRLTLVYTNCGTNI